MTLEERRRSAAHAFVADLDVPVLVDDDRHHLARVLRLGIGEVVTVSDGAGSWRTCSHRGDGELAPDGDVIREAARPVRLTVGFVVMKGDRPEGVVQKLTELGIDRIVPLHSARSVVRWDPQRAHKNVDRLRRVAREAAMQSRQVYLPHVDAVRDLADVVGETGCALAEPGGGPLTLGTAFVVVGPEGGFTPAEVSSAPALVRLPGDGILRADTAAVTCGAILATLRDSLTII